MPALRVLLADDNCDCTESMARLLRLLGHEVWTVDNGKAVCDEAARRHPHLIFVDIGMPGIDGYEVARRLRGQVRGTTVVALSGLATETDKRKALEAGFDDHFAKPMEVATLERLLDSVADPQPT